MRIAQIAPLTEAIPPELYGGTERVVSWLTEELVALGHDVTLFASGNSRTSAKLEAMWPRALRLDDTVRDPMALHIAMLERVRRLASRFDVLHFHLDYLPFSVFSRQATPFITTMHGRLDLPEHQTVFNAFGSIPVISISDMQRKPVPQARWLKTIYHGLPADRPVLFGPSRAGAKSAPGCDEDGCCALRSGHLKLKYRRIGIMQGRCLPRAHSPYHAEYGKQSDSHHLWEKRFLLQCTCTNDRSV